MTRKMIARAFLWIGFSLEAAVSVGVTHNQMQD
jgi:hypothetical protein